MGNIIVVIALCVMILFCGYAVGRIVNSAIDNYDLVAVEAEVGEACKEYEN